MQSSENQNADTKSIPLGEALNSYFQLILISQFTEQDLRILVLIARILHFQLYSILIQQLFSE